MQGFPQFQLLLQRNDPARGAAEDVHAWAERVSDIPHHLTSHVDI